IWVFRTLNSAGQSTTAARPPRELTCTRRQTATGLARYERLFYSLCKGGPLWRRKLTMQLELAAGIGDPVGDWQRYLSERLGYPITHFAVQGMCISLYADPNRKYPIALIDPSDRRIKPALAA